MNIHNNDVPSIHMTALDNSYSGLAHLKDKTGLAIAGTPPAVSQEARLDLTPDVTEITSIWHRKPQPAPRNTGTSRAS